jgi:uncharacterized RDD family membrane protein YckC
MEQPINSIESTENNDDFMFPQLAGFWRRVAAFLIDGLLLGILGQIIGWSAPSFWFTIGPYGRTLGLIIVLAYFGLMYSKVSNGQTVGKRLLKIAVRDKNNKPLSIRRSLLRISILTFPALLNGWALPIFNNTIINWLVGIIVFGGIVTIVYTMVFNRGSRQGIHDLICGTYVVRLRGENIKAFPITAKKHWIVSGMLVAIVIVIVTTMAFFKGNIISKVGLTDIAGVQEILNNDDRFHTVGVQTNTTRFIAGNVEPDRFNKRSISVTVWYKGVPTVEERSEVMNDVSEVVLGNVDNIDQYDSIRIIIKSAYDLGISSGSRTYSDNKSTDEWRLE